MSLLLEALKKAEAAKQQAAAGQQTGSSSAEPASAETAGTAAPLELAPEKPLITRDRLPDITQPLEILSEDLPSAAAPKRDRAAPAASAASGRELTLADSPGSKSAAAATPEQERAQARQLFEAKSPDYNPRRPFYYLVGAIGVLAIGIASYFAYQIFAPRPSFYTGPPGGKATPAPGPVAAAPVQPAPVQSAPVQPAPPQPAPAPTPPATQAEVAPAPTPTPAAKAVAPAPPELGTGAAKPAAASTRARTAPAQRRMAESAPAAAATAAVEPRSDPPNPPARTFVRVTPSGPRVDPNVERGWSALQAGDLAQAREAYLQALRANPRDRDALLGLAAIDTRMQDFASAEARYTRVLELDPRDAYAQASLLALRGQADPVQTESRLKNLIAQQPDSTVLNFSLGNQYAAQRRWADAQQAYFAAMAGDPDNPDYAYNLAVSLDHLRQPKLALEYYLRALSLAGSRPVGFNTAQVEARVRELQRR